MSTAAAAAEAPPASRGKKKLIILIAAAVLLLGVSGGAALLLLKKKAADAYGDEDTAQVEKAGPRSTRDPTVVPTFVPLEPFTVNLADRELERYAQVALTLELDDAKTGAQVKAYMPAIRNNILMVLSHKTSAQILSNEGKLVLAGEIQRATSRALGYEVEEPVPVDVDKDANVPRKTKSRKPQPALPVVAVHFSNFIVQ
ncbi:MAG: flagellar basal body rod protein [Rubrivivax sp. SCN 71-131]|jgi:flagellar FliL protein|nr:MAG: flagellar basal body rod protein [Rubrivivax sp. SCN 71-131]